MASIGCPDELATGETATISFQNGGASTVTIRIDNGGDESETLTIQLDDNGYGETTWQVPSGWSIANFNAEGAQEVTVVITSS